ARLSYDGAHCYNCATYDNGSGSFDAVMIQFNCQELTGSSPFTNAATGDFSLTLTGNGALLRSAGFPGTTVQGSVGYPDIGAVQHADPAASGGETSHVWVR